MKRIKVLSQLTANQIAAGEVVERPASVVKELVENALDAGASAITIETKGGGLESIRVTDNGCGIPAEDVETAFLRHATSKISTADDLSHIETLGFRGEALASIAAVSHVTLKTCTAEEEAGTLLRVSGGEVKENHATGTPQGTAIEVENLFFNVPARLKFIKSARAESAYISDYISRMLMARADVAFKLVQNGKTVFQSAGDTNLQDAIYCVYGADMLPHLRELFYDDGYVRLSGFIATEQAARSNRNAQSFFINARYIKSQKLSFALQRAYDMRLMVGKFPFAVLSLAISPNEIDVNVHPNKLDVRFKNEERVMRAATIAARQALGDPVSMPISHTTGGGWPQTEFSRSAEYARKTQDRETIPSITAYAPDSKEECVAQASFFPFDVSTKPAQPPILREPESVTVAPQVKIPERQLTPWQKSSSSMPEALSEPKTEQAQERDKRPAPLAERNEQLRLTCGSYRIIGQVFDCYWIVQQDEDTFFIDQHAAHERRLYERFAEKGVAAQSQILLIPAVIKLSPLEFETLMENLPQFAELGFDIEEFGMLTVSVRAVPYLIGEPQAAAFLHEAIALLDRRNRLSTVELKRAALIQAACKHAVKAGETLDHVEIEALLREYETEGMPLTCPHGRPVMVKMAKIDFEKLFKRVL